jgi:hypothetical protein
MELSFGVAGGFSFMSPSSIFCLTLQNSRLKSRIARANLGMFETKDFLSF